MKKLLFPLVLLLLGTGGGVAAALFVFPAHEEVAEIACAPEAAPEGEEMTADGAEDMAEDPPEDGEEEAPTREYAKLNNQFVVPMVENGRVTSLMVMSLSVEVEIGTKEAVFAAEPKLRDVFLQVLFDHANIGGFEGTFTSSANMRVLRAALKTAAQGALGEKITDVLIVDIVRQDI